MQESASEAVPTEAPVDVTVPLDKTGILAFRTQAGKIHPVKAFNGELFVKEWTSAERDAFEASLVVGKGKAQKVSTANIRAKMFVRAVVNAKGERLFGDEDAGAVGQLPAAEVDRVYTVIQKVNSFSDEDIEELAGNSDSGPSASGQS